MSKNAQNRLKHNKFIKAMRSNFIHYIDETYSDGVFWSKKYVSHIFYNSHGVFFTSRKERDLSYVK
jgi:hypothetical protein